MVMMPRSRRLVNSLHALEKLTQDQVLLRDASLRRPAGNAQAQGQRLEVTGGEIDEQLRAEAELHAQQVEALEARVTVVDEEISVDAFEEERQRLHAAVDVDHRQAILEVEQLVGVAEARAGFVAAERDAWLDEQIAHGVGERDVGESAEHEAAATTEVAAGESALRVQADAVMTKPRHREIADRVVAGDVHLVVARELGAREIEP